MLLSIEGIILLAAAVATVTTTTTITTTTTTTATTTSLLSKAQHPSADQGLLSIEVSRSNPDTPHLVGPLWTRDRPEAKTST